MRLGKEQATGYVEDTVGFENTSSLGNTEADSIVAEDIKIDSSERTPLTPAPEPVTVTVAG